MIARLRSSVGPYGGSGGSIWDDNKHDGIKNIKLTWGDMINSMAVEYIDKGTSSWSSTHGGGGATRYYTISLDYPHEYLISVSGSYRRNANCETIGSLSFQSNKRNFGPFGYESGKKFSLWSPGANIVGFHGKSGTRLDALGAYLASGIRELNGASASNVRPTASLVGPFGGSGGSVWDDSQHDGIKNIIIIVGDMIDSMAVQYHDNGTSSWSSKHGGDDGFRSYTISLDYPHEYLISVSGYYRMNANCETIGSLSFQSNKRKFAPLGIEIGTKFSLSSPGAKIVGFHGKSGTRLDALGAYFSSGISKLDGASVSNTSRTVVLVGKTGNGKSATGNSIIGKTIFKSGMSFESVTKYVQVQKSYLIQDQTIEVIDTPGLFDTSFGYKTIGNEIVKCIDVATNGIHAVLVVLSTKNRFSQEEEAAIYCLQTLFGSKIFDYAIVIFTGGDNLDEEAEDDDVGHERFNDYLHNSPKNLQDFIKLCGNRTVLFDNKTKDESKKSEQVRKLFILVDKVLEENGGEPYTRKHFGKDGMLKLHGKDGGFERELLFLKEQIQNSYDEQLKQVAAKMEFELRQKTRKLEAQIAGEQAYNIRPNPNPECPIL